ncbi:MAG: DNA-3-methyladenine glycosylase [Bacteroidales bacterium]|nr:DNA-3-methyladenine glycosylase [Bacteroidales bacterium]
MERNIAGKEIIEKIFFEQGAVTDVAHRLLGKRLVTQRDGVLTSGIISETEAYAGRSDKASHAWNGRLTQRTEVMFRPGGCIYVYLCYGIHSLLNIVTNKQGEPDAVLIRGIIPEEGVAAMLQRRGAQSVNRNLTNGPGKVSQALGVHYTHTGRVLGSSHDDFRIWVEQGRSIDPAAIETAPRIGIDYAGDDRLNPWRFVLKKSSPVKVSFHFSVYP